MKAVGNVIREAGGIVIDGTGGAESVAEQMAEPEVRQAIGDLVKAALRTEDASPSDSLWGEVPTEAAEPIAFAAERKALLAGLQRTQHAMATDDERPVLQSWWLTVESRDLVIHTADNYRLARATVEISTTLRGTFGIHRSDGKALLAFLASGPRDLSVDVSGGAWAISHDEGQLTGRLAPGTPPTWAAITVERPRTLTLAQHARFMADAAKAAEAGGSGVVRMEWEADDKATVYRSAGLDEWIMPVRIGAPVSPPPREDEPEPEPDQPEATPPSEPVGCTHEGEGLPDCPVCHPELVAAADEARWAAEAERMGDPDGALLPQSGDWRKRR